MTSVMITINTTVDTDAADDNAVISVKISYLVFMLSLSLFTIVGNILIIIAFWKVPSLREKPSELLILNLSFVDLCTGFMLLYLCPVFIFDSYYPLGEIGCRFSSIFFNVTVSASVFTLVAISTDRFLLVLIAYPKYLKWQSTPRIRLAIVMCWAFAVLFNIIEQSLWNVAKTLNTRAAEIDFDKVCLSPPRRLSEYSLYAFFGVYLSPVLIVCVLSSAFFVLLWRRIQRSNRVDTTTQSTIAETQQDPSQVNDTNGTDSQPSTRKRNSRYTKPALSLIVLVSAMGLLYASL